MKKSIFLTVIALGLLIALSPADQTRQKPQSAEALLGAALHQEEIEGNLEAAIGTYKKLLAEFPGNRALAAEAQFRIGTCYEKLGRLEAQKAYEEVLAKYSDQPEFVSKARQRLTALQAGLPASAQPVHGTNLVIRRGPDFDMYARPSPDGKYMAYIDWDTGNLAIQDLATGEKRLLTNDGAMTEKASRYPETFAWSRDSARLVYSWPAGTSNPWSMMELRIVSPNRDVPPQKIPLPDSTYPTWIAEWSRDGSRVLCYMSQDRGRTQKMAWIDVLSHAIEAVNPKLERAHPVWTKIYAQAGDETVLYSKQAQGPGTPFDIYLGNLKTGESTPVIEHPAEDLLVGMLPGTDWLLFLSDRRGRLDLWGVTFREGKTIGPPVLVKQGIGRLFPLGFTNDGSYSYATMTVTDDIFFADYDPETHRVGGEPRKLASPYEGANMDSRFSPDGKYLAYVTKRGPLPIPTHTADSLAIQSLDDSGSAPLVVDFREYRLTRVEFTHWAGDGKSLGVMGWRGDEMGLIRVDFPSLVKKDYYWAPEGSRIGWPAISVKTGSVYLTDGIRGASKVMRINLDGGNEEVVYRSPEGQQIKSIALSPDESTLSIITSTDGIQCSLLLFPLTGGPARQLHEFAQKSSGGVTQSWAPDGKAIFYVVLDKKHAKDESWQWSVFRIPAQGAGPRELVLNYPNPAYGAELHPNGRLLAFSGRNGASSDAEIWVMENIKEELKKLAKERK
jgi:Tol biopolymer transport system component